jgi:hypothetical protein
MYQALPIRALPSRALPSRALPSRALLLISEYSKPLTRSDWRESIPIITTSCLYDCVYYLLDFNHKTPSKYSLEYRLLCNILQTDWYYLREL